MVNRGKKVQSREALILLVQPFTLARSDWKNNNEHVAYGRIFFRIERDGGIKGERNVG